MAKKCEITDIGLNEKATAEANGFKLSLTTFAVTDAVITEDQVQRTNNEPIGNILYQGPIDVVEVLNPSTVKLTLTVRGNIPDNGVKWTIQEIVVFTETGAMFCQGYLDPPLEKENSYDTQVELFITWARLGEVVNINTTAYTAISSVGAVKLIPRPVDISQNAVSVLNGQGHPDHTTGPLLALKYGPGAEMWGFTGHDRIYYGTPDDLIFKYDNGDPPNVIGVQLVLNPDEKGFYVKPGDILLVQAVVGQGYGQTRKMRYDGDNVFTEVEGLPFQDVDQSTTFAFWKNMSPEVNAIGALLKPQFLTYSFVCDGQGKSFVLPTTPLTNDYVWTFVNGAFCTDAFTEGTTLILDKVYPNKYKVDVTVLKMVPDPINTGTALTLNSYSFIGDGSTRKFTVGAVPPAVDNVFVYLGTVAQQRNKVYKLQGNQIAFTVPPEKDVVINIDVYSEIISPNTNARLVVHRAKPTDRTINLYSGNAVLGDVVLYVDGVYQQPSVYATNAQGIVVSVDPAPGSNYVIYELRKDPMYLNLRRPYTQAQLIGRRIMFTRQDGQTEYLDLSPLFE